MNDKPAATTAETSGRPAVPAEAASPDGPESDASAMGTPSSQGDTDLEARVCRIFADQLMIVVPDVQADLIDSGLLDSLTMVELLLHLEREFGFTVVMDELDVDDFRRVSRIAGYVARSRD